MDTETRFQGSRTFVEVETRQTLEKLGLAELRSLQKQRQRDGQRGEKEERADVPGGCGIGDPIWASAWWERKLRGC